MSIADSDLIKLVQQLQEQLQSAQKDVNQLHQIIKVKDQEINLYQSQLLKFSHQLDHVMIQISSDVDLLKKLQLVLAPTETPQFPGFEFSKKFVYGSKFGGDYFDIFEHKDKKRFGVLLSSASGYALSALFLSIVLKLTHIIETTRLEETDSVMLQIAHEISEVAKPQDNLDLFYGVVDRRDLSFHFSSAGRIVGFLQTPRSALQILGSKYKPLGVDKQEHYQTLSLELEPQSKLVLVTQGVLEILTQNEVADLVQKFSQPSQTHDIRNEILMQCQLKSGLDTPLRDQTVVVIEVKDKVIKLAK